MKVGSVDSRLVQRILAKALILLVECTVLVQGLRTSDTEFPLPDKVNCRRVVIIYRRVVD